MNNILCKHHPDNQIIFIIWNQNKLQLVCDECMGTTHQEGILKDDKWKKLAIRKAFKEPEYFLQQFKLDDKNQSLMKSIAKCPESQLRDLIQRIEANLKDIQITLDKVINDLKEEVCNILNNKSNFRKQLEKVSEYSKFKELIESLNNTSQTITHDVVNQVQTKLQEIFINLEQDTSNLNKEIQNFLASTKINRIYVFQGIQQFKEQIKQFLNIIEPNNKFIVSESYFKDFLLNKISLDAGKTIKSTNLILNEQQQNLNHYLFWKCVQNKSNLLMIFKSQSGNIFGAYSPLQWVYEDRKIDDRSKTTFLFSYTHKSTHKLINQDTQYSIYFEKENGPCFNEDLYIKRDFQDGYSKLGKAYSRENSKDPNTHLFGQKTPNIIECRIFEIIFQ
ncbi:unnamed protein product [Paramecium primaurelia]|uniref:TLDc domain-containing protein n=1 Tax=Paramecium primaurelia TaxID=5886 RepID=A0A8S1N195_PARPR|nr:unnamed protein product [Paramecium primaurelia]